MCLIFLGFYVSNKIKLWFTIYIFFCMELVPFHRAYVCFFSFNELKYLYVIEGCTPGDYYFTS